MGGVMVRGEVVSLQSPGWESLRGNPGGKDSYGDSLPLVECAASARACLKITFRQMYVTLCGRFCRDEGGVVGYAD